MIDDPLNRLKVKRGSELPQAKLTEDQVRQLLRLAAKRRRVRQAVTQRLGNRALARRFGVSVSTVERILAGETWSHVAEAE